MTGTTTTISVEDMGLDKVESLLAEITARGMDLSPPLSAVGEYLLLSHNERFARQISPQGVAWQPLSDAYIESEVKKGSRGSDKILVLDGYLRDLLRYQIEGGDSLVFGSDRDYASRHQFGDSRTLLPARPFLGLSGEDETEVEQILMDYLSQPLDENVA
jgi:phage virion morphogenesis protein